MTKLRYTASLPVIVALIVTDGAFASSSTTAPARANVEIPVQFNYAAMGEDRQGPYKIFTHFLTGYEQIGKNPQVWVKITRTKPKSTKDEQYDAQFLLFYIDCPSLTYGLLRRVDKAPDGRILKDLTFTKQKMVLRQLPDPKNHIKLKQGVATPEQHAAVVLDQSCKPFE